MLAQEADPAMRDALRLQMMEFGRTPRQVGQLVCSRACMCGLGVFSTRNYILQAWVHSWQLH